MLELSEQDVYLTGKMTENVVPEDDDSSQIRPWCFSTMVFTIDSPNPVPGIAADRLLPR